MRRACRRPETARTKASGPFQELETARFGTRRERCRASAPLVVRAGKRTLLLVHGPAIDACDHILMRIKTHPFFDRIRWDVLQIWNRGSVGWCRVQNPAGLTAIRAGTGILHCTYSPFAIPTEHVRIRRY